VLARHREELSAGAKATLEKRQTPSKPSKTKGHVNGKISSWKSKAMIPDIRQ
jgi:hypothetical protein